MHTAKSDTSDEYVHELLNSFMVTGRYSKTLERQIAFALWQRIANVHVICNEIGAIEKHPLAKSSRTKRDEALTGDLAGLRHKHLMDARFIAKNVFIALAPDLPGCSAFGASRFEALSELDDVIEAWIAAARAAGNPIPEPSTLAAHARA